MIKKTPSKKNASSSSPTPVSDTIRSINTNNNTNKKNDMMDDKMQLFEKEKKKKRHDDTSVVGSMSSSSSSKGVTALLDSIGLGPGVLQEEKEEEKNDIGNGLSNQRRRSERRLKTDDKIKSRGSSLSNNGGDNNRHDDIINQSPMMRRIRHGPNQEVVASSSKARQYYQNSHRSPRSASSSSSMSLNKKIFIFTLTITIVMFLLQISTLTHYDPDDAQQQHHHQRSMAYHKNLKSRLNQFAKQQQQQRKQRRKSDNVDQSNHILGVVSNDRKRRRNITNQRNDAITPIVNTNDFYDSLMKEEVQDDDANRDEMEIKRVMDEIVPSGTFTNLVNVVPREQQQQVTNTTTALFWKIPRSGGGLIQKILTECHDELVLASDAAATIHDFIDETKLGRVKINGHTFINIDTTTPAGLLRAQTLHLTESHLAHVIITPHLHQASSTLFSFLDQGKAFTMIRHPIDRAISSYRYLLSNGRIPSEMTIVEYGESVYMEQNWMVRFLSGNMDGELNEEYWMVAKEVLRTKFLIGLLDVKVGSLVRMEHYFGWNLVKKNNKKDGRVFQCRKRILDHHDDNASWLFMKRLERDEPDFRSILASKNEWDMKLYEYAIRLFHRQGQELFRGVSGIHAK